MFVIRASIGSGAELTTCSNAILRRGVVTSRAARSMAIAGSLYATVPGGRSCSSARTYWIAPPAGYVNVAL